MYAPPRYPPFFLSDHASPGALHSSPTRRSSDLAGRLAQTKATNAEVKKFAERMIADHEGVNKQAIALAKTEEHTSELQSLAYLVCRLLLEKKKPKTISAL